MDQSNLLSIPAIPWEAGVNKNGHYRLVVDLYDREQTPLKRYLSMLGVDPETAADVVQDAFLKLHEHLLAGGDQRNLRAWLYRVAHNSARNRQMSYGARRTGSLEDLAVSSGPMAKEQSVEEQILERERDGQLKRAIDQLSESQRACLVLRAQGLKYREIADTLDLSISTVGENIQRSLERLKELI